MVKRLNVFLITTGIQAMFLSACGGITKNPSDDDFDPAGEGLPPVAAVKAREALSVELGVDIEEITIVSHEQMTCLDLCLG